ncbi:AAA family ATPase [Streptomyces sp. HNM0645]|uniref:AAA family ATPase n=1 Tax=Streptomyces sp. HNM0645 TaxID=2782343 RepID=UPI00035CAFD6|nr:AAA family ATPase [Streptomyces sp. HNM0645]MDI9889315.1 AAA family ATPase [Streptomyces sp. HNM0645]
MDKRTNPFTPNAGATPPVLVGRDSFLEDYEILLDRLVGGYAEKSMLITGLRGVGKTVLLNEFERIAKQRDWVPVWAEISPSYEFAQRMYSLVRQALLDLSPSARWSDRFKRAAGVLKSFNITFSPDGSVSGALDAEAVEGAGDSGFLDRDLSDIIQALGEAARERGRGVVFLFDELQFLSPLELESLVVALHRGVQRRLPVTLVGAGLPQLPELVGDARSYAERLFKFPQVSQLSSHEVELALTRPVNGALKFTGGALARVFEHTEGYPYFVQEYGRALWNLSVDGNVSSIHVDQAEREVSAELDSAFFQVRTDRLSPDELSVLRAMAEFGKGPVALDELAPIVRTGGANLDQLLTELTTRAMVYSPRFGQYAFTVPHYDGYLRRRFPFTDGRMVWAP